MQTENLFCLLGCDHLIPYEPFTVFQILLIWIPPKRPHRIIETLARYHCQDFINGDNKTKAFDILFGFSPCILLELGGIKFIIEAHVCGGVSDVRDLNIRDGYRM